MPFRFPAPDGLMEITVRSALDATTGAPGKYFSAAATFVEAGPRALTRIPLSAKSDTYGSTLRALTEGFRVTTAPFDKDSIEFRVLTALCSAQGVVELDA